MKILYRVTLVVEYLGWVDFDLGCSTILLGQLIATVAGRQPGELPKSKSTNHGTRPPVTPYERFDMHDNPFRIDNGGT